jgi:hypothetical protein
VDHVDPVSLKHYEVGMEPPAEDYVGRDVCAAPCQPRGYCTRCRWHTDSDDPSLRRHVASGIHRIVGISDELTWAQRAHRGDFDSVCRHCGQEISLCFGLVWAAVLDPDCPAGPRHEPIDSGK